MYMVLAYGGGVIDRVIFERFIIIGLLVHNRTAYPGVVNTPKIIAVVSSITLCMTYRNECMGDSSGEGLLARRASFCVL